LGQNKSVRVVFILLYMMMISFGVQVTQMHCMCMKDTLELTNVHKFSDTPILEFLVVDNIKS